MNKDLKRMSRGELLEILIFQVEENERLKAELETCREELERRQIAIAETGTLAEAALKLNRVFESADAAAKQYLENVRFAAGITETVVETGGVESQFSEVPEISAAKRQAEEIIAVAKAKSEKMIRDADNYWRDTLKKARVLLNK